MNAPYIKYAGRQGGGGLKVIILGLEAESYCGKNWRELARGTNRPNFAIEIKPSTYFYNKKCSVHNRRKKLPNNFFLFKFLKVNKLL